MTELSHVDGEGRARMVDVSSKAPAVRVAEATARVRMKKETRAMIMENRAPKGDVLAVAKVAGIMAAKKTPDLVPLCHPLPVDLIDVEFEEEGEDSIRINTLAKVIGPTGIEMEAVTAAALAAVTIYDMVKAVDRGVVVEDLHLVKKSGGKSGDYVFEKDGK